jgi:hypothetical protein
MDIAEKDECAGAMFAENEGRRWSELTIAQEVGSS